jgi:two-component sensor histidine kinase
MDERERRARLEMFGARAAECPDIAGLLDAACQELAAVLAVSHVKALEYLSNEQSLLLRAGFGWREGVVGNTRIPAGLESAAGFTLQTGKPTIANDLLHEQRFHVPGVLREHGVRSAANVLIKCEDFVYGVIEADSNEPRQFDEEDLKVLRCFANTLALAVAQAKLAEQNFELCGKMETLYRELAHRTKNNNQMLMSMVRLQANRAQTMDVRRALDDVLARISLLGTIDDALTLCDDTDRIDIPSFIATVAGKVFAAMSDNAQRVRLITDLQDGVLPRAHAQAIAIILNEFITNSFKYGLEEGGTLTVAVHADGDRWVIDLRDDGPGRPSDAPEGLGAGIMAAMAREIDGRMEWVEGAGAHLRVTLARKL